MNTKELLRQAGAFDIFGREVRTGHTGPTEVREGETAEDFVLYGHAAVFDQEAVIAGYFREVIVPGAFKKTLKDGADVRHLFNHDPNYVLARTKSGTLVLSEDAEGLAFAAQLNKADPDAVRVAEKVRRGDVDQSSFAMRVIREEWIEPEDDNSRDLPLRRILEAQLFDTSTVTYPAFEAASSLLRSQGIQVLQRAAGLDESRLAGALKILASASPAPEVAPLVRSVSETLGTLADMAAAEAGGVSGHTHTAVPITGVSSHDHTVHLRVTVTQRAAEEALEPSTPVVDDAVEMEQLQLRHRLRARAQGR